MRIVDVDVPAPAEGQVLVRTLYSGISGGTELLAYRGEIEPSLPLDETLGALSGTFAYPFSFGYSAVGRVEDSRASISPGSLVFAFHPHQDRFVVDAEAVIPLDGHEPRSATLLPLLETALQVCLDAAPRYGDDVVVTGLGPVGILSAALLSLAGARVIGAEPLPARREAASRFGVHSIPPAQLEKAVLEATAGRGARLFVETSGNPSALVDALPLLAHEGVALVVSWYGTKTVPLPLGAEFHRRRLQLRSSQVSTIPAELAARWDVPRRRDEARALLRRLPVEVLATHDFEFERASDAYDALDRGLPELIHATLRYG